MTIHRTITAAPVHHEVRVKLPPAEAFDLFANHFDAWWPRDKTVNMKSTLVEAVLEPRVGGRWYEKDADGSVCEWGHVTAYEPGKRLVLDWQLAASYTFDPDLHTEVEILFKPDGAGTLVTLDHRNIERFGAQFEQMRAGIAGANGWPSIMDSYVSIANGR